MQQKETDSTMTNKCREKREEKDTENVPVDFDAIEMNSGQRISYAQIVSRGMTQKGIHKRAVAAQQSEFPKLSVVPAVTQKEVEHHIEDQKATEVPICSHEEDEDRAGENASATDLEVLEVSLKEHQAVSDGENEKREEEAGVGQKLVPLDTSMIPQVEHLMKPFEFNPFAKSYVPLQFRRLPHIRYYIEGEWWCKDCVVDEALVNNPQYRPYMQTKKLRFRFNRFNHLVTQYWREDTQMYEKLRKGEGILRYTWDTSAITMARRVNKRDETVVEICDLSLVKNKDDFVVELKVFNMINGAEACRFFRKVPV